MSRVGGAARWTGTAPESSPTREGIPTREEGNALARSGRGAAVSGDAESDEASEAGGTAESGTPKEPRALG